MNDRIPSSPPLILPVPDNVKRPLWSVMIPAFNCLPYLRQTMESVLMQDAGPGIMQIEVIDDASTDGDVEQLVKETGKGRIHYFRQPENRGSLRNFETCLNRARGAWVHLLHGDDFVDKGFYQEIESLFLRFPEAGAAYTGFRQIDAGGTFVRPHDTVLTEPGIIKDWLTIIAQAQKVQPPAMVVKRSVYEHLGGFFGVHYAEDWEMWVRIAAHYPVAHSPLQLANYRNHDNNISSRYFVSGQHMKDILTVIDIIRHYLPADQKERLTIGARKNWSQYFARTSDMTYGLFNNPSQALRQSLMALRMHKNPVSFYYLFKTGLKVLAGYRYRGKT